LTSVDSSLRVIVGLPSTVSIVTSAVVLTESGTCSSALSAAASAIEKQPACAAAISSSGLVPSPLSKREAKE
jgi:hypothetical protein